MEKREKMEQLILKDVISVSEFLEIIEAVGWKTYSKAQVEKACSRHAASARKGWAGNALRARLLERRQRPSVPADARHGSIAGAGCAAAVGA